MNGSSHFPRSAILHGARQPRRDFLTAQHIDVGIAIQRCFGTYAAAKYLSEKKVEISVVRRVLTQSLNTRTYRDWNYSSRRATDL